MKPTGLFGARRLAKRRCRDALVETRGNLVNAARLLGCSRQNVWEMVSRHADLRTLCDELLEESKDIWEDKLEKIGVDQSNPTALLGLLNAHARDRGYARHQSDVVVSGSIGHRHAIVGASERFAHLSDDDLARLLESRLALEADDPKLITVHPPKGET